MMWVTRSRRGHVRRTGERKGIYRVVIGKNLNLKDHLEDVGSCEDGDELSGSTKYGTVLPKIRNYLLVLSTVYHYVS
jgi:hypothetical protein